jgi:hypothetical protein
MSKRGNIKKENSKEWKEYQVASDNINHFNRQNEFIMVDGESVANDVTKMPEYKILNKKFKESLKKVNQMGYAKGGVPDYVNWEYPIYFDSEGKEYVAIYYSDRTDEAEADTDFDNRIADSLIPDVIKEHLGDNKWEEQDVEAELGKEEFFNDLEYALETSSISGERVDYAKGGSVEDKEYVLDRYYVYVNKDSWTEGQTEEVQHWDSSDYGEDNQVFSSKSDLMHFIKGVIERDTDEDNVEDKYFNIDADDDDTKIDYSVLCKYIDLDRGYDHYEKASDEEIEKWKKGELELVSVGFTFAVSTYSIRVKAEFEKGGKITDSMVWNNMQDDGDIIEHWASDVGGSNQSVDNIITYSNGKNYLVTTNFDQDMLVTPSKTATEWEDDDYAKGGKVEKKGNEMIMGGLAGILFGFLLNK